jgi:cystathionine beta-lyase/cystathionine gamma-synthase
VLVGSKPEHKERFAFVQKCVGAILSPFECYLILRGVKTLAVRMRQHDSNGRILAEYLAGHPRVKKVFYPGLRDHPQHELAKRQQSGFGSLLSFETGSFERANAIMKALRLCIPGESLGGVETLVCHPASMTHAALGAEGRSKIGITDGLLRISVGIEDVEDLIADLDQALQSS